MNWWAGYSSIRTNAYFLFLLTVPALFISLCLVFVIWILAAHVERNDDPDINSKLKTNETVLFILSCIPSAFIAMFSYFCIVTVFRLNKMFQTSVLMVEGFFTVAPIKQTH